jgi:tetratricopeptide (TPR) repeat protein
LIKYFMRIQPDEPKLRQLYQDVYGFEDEPHRVSEEPIESRRYWRTLMKLIRRHNRFPSEQKQQQRDYFAYWSEQMGQRFPEWDGYHINRLVFQFLADRDLQAWKDGLDQQFEDHQEPGDYQRIIRWIDLFGRFPKKVQEYYAKLKFSDMTNGEIFDAARTFHGRVGDMPLAVNTFRKIRIHQPGVEDSLRNGWLGWAGSLPEEELVIWVAQSYNDQDLGKMQLLRFYREEENAEKGVPLAEELVLNQRFATEAWTIKAELHEFRAQWQEAIAAWRSANQPPQTAFNVAECYLAWGKPEEAVRVLFEIENFFPKVASKAAQRIAQIRGKKGATDQYYQALRRIILKYEGSREASWAHNRIERTFPDRKIGGAVDHES